MKGEGLISRESSALAKYACRRQRKRNCAGSRLLEVPSPLKALPGCANCAMCYHFCKLLTSISLLVLRPKSARWQLMLLTVQAAAGGAGIAVISAVIRAIAGCSMGVAARLLSAGEFMPAATGPKKMGPSRLAGGDSGFSNICGFMYPVPEGKELSTSTAGLQAWRFVLVIIAVLCFRAV